MDVENVVRTLLEALEARAQVFERAHAHDAQHNPVMCIMAYDDLPALDHKIQQAQQSLRTCEARYGKEYCKSVFYRVVNARKV